MFLGNLIQEAGRAGRDKREAKHTIYYLQQDIKTVYGIIAGEQERYLLFFIILFEFHLLQISVRYVIFIKSAKKKIN